MFQVGFLCVSVIDLCCIVRSTAGLPHPNLAVCLANRHCERKSVRNLRSFVTGVYNMYIDKEYGCIEFSIH